MLTSFIIVAIVGYLLGALPFGYLVARAKGVNIFEVGSKNPGATNVRRVLGAGPGNLVFALDALKGALATAWPALLVFWRHRTGASALGIPVDGGGEAMSNQHLLVVAGLVGALLGHSFSCFTKFRGGKGVATATGGLLMIIPLTIAIAAAVWALTFYTTRYVSLASMLAALTLPVVLLVRGAGPILVGLAAAIAVFVIIRHRTNIQRLFAGTEAKFVKKPRTQTP